MIPELDGRIVTRGTAKGRSESLVKDKGGWAKKQKL